MIAAGKLTQLNNRDTPMSHPVTRAELAQMHRTAAALVITDPVYLPIFERIEREIAIMDAQDDAISRARAILACHKAAA